MPIEKIEDGGVIATGQGVHTFQLIALKHALSLFERTGIRPSRNVHPLKIAQKITGVRGRAYDKMYARLDELIAESNAKDKAP